MEEEETRINGPQVDSDYHQFINSTLAVQWGRILIKSIREIN